MWGRGGGRRDVEEVGKGLRRNYSVGEGRGRSEGNDGEEELRREGWEGGR